MAYGNGNPVGTASVGNSSMVAPPRPPIISEQMNCLEQRTEGIHVMLNELEARLSPVLMPDSPEVNKEGPSVNPPVPLGASLAQSNMRLSQAFNRIQALIGRIEL